MTMTTKDKIRLVIAEDHPLTREGLVLKLQQQYSDRFEVVGEAESGYTALELCLAKKPDILILDWHLPGNLDGYDVLRILRQKAIPIKIMLLTGDDRYTDRFTGEMAPDLCLLKGVATKTILEKLEYLANEDYQPMPTNSRWATDREAYIKALTPREKEILGLVCQGKMDKEIAQRLGISEGTVGGHLHSIYTKVGVNTRIEAANFALNNRLASLEEAGS